MIRLLENFREVNRNLALQILRNELESISRDLTIVFEFVDLDDGGWAHVKYSGPDSEILTEILRKKYGIAPLDTELNKNLITRGVIVYSTIGFGLYIDISTKLSKSKDALYPLYSMRSQLTDGLKLSARQISKHFCLRKGLPLEVRVVKVDQNVKEVIVELSDRQVSNFRNWKKLPFDRIVIIGCSKERLKNILSRTNSLREIADLESLSLIVHVLICKLGTDVSAILKCISSHLKGINTYIFYGKQPRRKGDFSILP